MQHLVIVLICAHFAIGVVLTCVGAMHELIVESVQEVRMRQSMRAPGEPAMPPAAVSVLVLTGATLLLWPCLWPTAVCRREMLMRRFPGLSTFGD